MYKNKGMLISIVLFTLIFGCTQKKNSVGFENVNEPKEIILGDSIFTDISGHNFISFEDSLKNYSSNSDLIIAKYNSNNYSNESRTLIKSLNLPDTVNTIVSDIILNFPVDSKNDQFNITELKFGTLNSSWDETKTNWNAATDSTYWETAGGDFTEIDMENVIFENDTISVTLSENLIIDWIDNTENNFGLIIYTETDNFITELYSSETLFPPTLIFDYTDIFDEEIHFSQTLSSDTFISNTDDIYEIYPDQIIFSNIQPIRSYLKFNFDKSYFEGISDSIDFKRMTINKAELLFNRKSTDSDYFENKTFSIKPYVVLSDSIDISDDSKPMIIDDEYEDYYNSTSTDSLSTTEEDLFKVDITKIVQGFTTGNIENRGILLRSIYESKNLRHLEFETLDADAPKLRIIYTIPILDE